MIYIKSMDKQEKNKYNKKYYQENKEQILKQQKEYQQTFKGKKSKKEINKRYRQLLRVKEYMKEYMKKWKQSFRGKISNKKYQQSLKGKVAKKKCNAIRRQLGFISFNEPFEGCEGHHIDQKRVIFIPKEIHRSVWHSLTSGIGMEKINKLAFEYLKKRS